MTADARWGARWCPRPGCGGRLFLEVDVTGGEWVCLLCSRRQLAVPLAALPLRQNIGVERSA